MASFGEIKCEIAFTDEAKKCLEEIYGLSYLRKLNLRLDKLEKEVDALLEKKRKEKIKK